MNPFQAGFFKEVIASGLSETHATDMWKTAMGYTPAATMFNNPGLDGQADPHQLQLASAMQQQAAAESQMQQMQQMMGAQSLAQAPAGVQ